MSGKKTGFDVRGALERIHAIQVELTALRQEVMEEKRRDGEFEEQAIPSTLAVEIMADSGTVIDDSNVHPTDSIVPIVNETGIEVNFSQGVGPGRIAIDIPAGETRGVRRNPGKNLRVEFVEYSYFDPCANGPRPGVLCIIQVYRNLIRRVVDSSGGDPNDAVLGTGKIVLRRSGGSFALDA